jgi:hypothetical protein
MSDNPFSNFAFHYLFESSMEAMEAKAEVFMSEAIEAMERIADSLTGHDEPRITNAERRAAVIKLCADTFDRLVQERAADLAEWKRRYRGG